MAHDAEGPRGCILPDAGAPGDVVRLVGVLGVSIGALTRQVELCERAAAQGAAISPHALLTSAGLLEVCAARLRAAAPAGPAAPVDPTQRIAAAFDTLEWMLTIARDRDGVIVPMTPKQAKVTADLLGKTADALAELSRGYSVAAGEFYAVAALGGGDGPAIG
jgi:hypothetical protein